MKSLMCALIVSCSLIPVHAQSLADVAKKVKEQRAAAQKQSGSEKPPAPKVYTNEDLKDAPPASIIGQAPEASPAVVAEREKAETERADEYRKAAKRDETYWKGQMRDRQAALDADTLQAAAMQTRVNSLDADLDLGTSIPDRTVVRREREKALTELVRLRALVLADRKAIATLEEEARRANVPPGWLRP